MQSVITASVFPLLSSNARPSCLCAFCLYLTYCYNGDTMLYQALFPSHVRLHFIPRVCVYFLFKVHFSFKRRKSCFIYQNGKLTFPKTLVSCSIDCPSMAWQMMVMTLLGALQGWWWCYLEHSKESRRQSTRVCKSRGSSVSPSQPCKDLASYLSYSKAWGKGG